MRQIRNHLNDDDDGWTIMMTQTSRLGEARRSSLRSCSLSSLSLLARFISVDPEIILNSASLFAQRVRGRAFRISFCSSTVHLAHTYRLLTIDMRVARRSTLGSAANIVRHRLDRLLILEKSGAKNVEKLNEWKKNAENKNENLFRTHVMSICKFSEK